MHCFSRQRRIQVTGMVFASVLFVGCGETGIFKVKTPYWNPAPQQVDAIAPMDLASRSIVPPQKPDDAMEELLAQELPIEAPTTQRTVSIVEVRQAVLEGNLELKTELVSPKIARANLGAEEAKFEATIFAGYTRNDQGVVTNLEQGESRPAAMSSSRASAFRWRPAERSPSTRWRPRAISRPRAYPAERRSPGSRMSGSRSPSRCCAGPAS